MWNMAKAVLKGKFIALNISVSVSVSEKKIDDLKQII